MARSSGKHLSEGLARFLRDLRSGDRRSGDRRESETSVRPERRERTDRRAGDRRQQSYEHFSLENTAFIQTLVVNPEAAAMCPRCESNLMLGPPFDRDGVTARRIQCTGCHRVTIVRADLADEERRAEA